MTAPIELGSGVYRVPTMPGDVINSYLIVEGDGSLTLIDAGLRRAPSRISAAIEALGKRSEDIGRIVLTHAHVDHAGGLATMRRRTAARVLGHAEDAPFAAAGHPPPTDRRHLGARLLGMLPAGRFDGCAIDQEIADGEVLAGGLRVVHTPGHTPGHVSLLHEPSGVLIVGDALFNVLRLRFSIKLWCSDVPLSRESAWRLGGLDFEVAAFMHGPAIADGAQERVRAFLRQKLEA